MAQESGRRSNRLSYGYRKRKTFLIFSTCLLTVAFCATLLINDLFNNLWLAISSFLLPAIQTGLAAAFLDKNRSHQKALLIVYLTFLLSMAMINFAKHLRTPLEELVTICCVNIVWGGLFQMGLDVVNPYVFMFPQLHAMVAITFISHSHIPVWAIAIPFSLGTMMIWLSHCLADSGAVSDRDCPALTTDLLAGGD